jgi:hypothetical protein
MKPVKTTLITILSFAAFHLVLSPHGRAAEFQNLDFESPILPLLPEPNDPYGRVPVGNALPGWTAFVGTDVESLALYNSSFLSSAGFSLLGPGPWLNDPITIPSNLIAGSYSALVKSGDPLGHPGQPGPAPASLAQTGLVPADTRWLFLSIDTRNSFSVSLGGQPLNLEATRQAPNYTVYGADITAFAGQTAELRITPEPTPANYGYLWFDSIEFSPVPEPGTVTLLVLGGLALVCQVRRPAPLRSSPSVRLRRNGSPTD